MSQVTTSAVEAIADRGFVVEHAVEDGARHPYHGAVLIEPDGSIRIAWEADGYSAIHVLARFRPRAELEAYARGVADAALFERTVPDLRVALRRTWPGAFDLTTREPHGGPHRVVVSFHPPRREGRPDD